MPTSSSHAIFGCAISTSLCVKLSKVLPGLENGNSTGNDGPESLFPFGFITDMGRT